MRAYSYRHDPHAAFAGPPPEAIEVINDLALRRYQNDINATTDFLFVERLWEYRLSYDRALKTLNGELDKERADLSLVWESLDVMLTAGARSSRMFWPSRKQYVERGKRMQTYYQDVLEPSLENRKMRDTIEHYDEIIADWIVEKGSLNRIEGFFAMRQVGVSDWLCRIVDPETRMFHFADRSIDLEALDRAMDFLADRSQHIQIVGEYVMRNGGSLPE